MPKITNLAKRTLKNLAVTFKPLSVHTEAVVLDEVWEKVKALARSGKVKRWYVMTPVNYDYTKQILNLKISKEEYSKILAKRYKWLLENNQSLELHIHLNKFMRISKEEQEELFKESIEWAKKELNLHFKEYVPGWWKDNETTLELAKKYGLRRPKFTEMKYIHDYDLIK